MDSLKATRRIVQEVLQRYADIPDAYGMVQYQAVFDEVRDHYLVLTLGWRDDHHIHNCLIHVEVREDKVWLHQNNTDQHVAEELIAAGVPRERIVLGFQPPNLRPYTDYAAA